MYIKNMACVRCQLLVGEQLRKIGYNPTFTEPGEVEISEEITVDEKRNLRNTLGEIGVELIDDRESILLEKIRHIITDLVFDTGDGIKLNISHYISSQLGYSYKYLSTLFSSYYGSSIEKYFIHLKIERAKEILIHEKLTFSEIAFKLHYCNVAHLSSQFKKETGLTLTQFRQINIERRLTLANR
jgi:AraC-like DNA-binding protein